MRIMFMGTPEIAAGCLCRILDDGHNVVAVVTGEDKPRGRGNVMTPTAVKAEAIKRGIPALTPKTLRDGSFACALDEYRPELIVVVAYGKILPSYVLDYPAYGCINAHVSLLPKYRGAAPMQRAVMNGERETGVTIMYMNEGLDTGDIITSESFEIGAEDDFETVHDRSMVVGGKLLSDVITAIACGTATRTPQDDSLATYAAKIEKSECKIDFSLPSDRLDCIIRGITPIPGAYAYLNGKMLKIRKATPVSGKGSVGEVIDASDSGEGFFTVACGSGALRVTSVIPEGKGKMSAGDFLRGRKIKIGDILE